MSNPTPAYALTVPIDWADLKHGDFECHPDGSLHHQQVSSSPASSDWLFALRSVSAKGRGAVAVEQGRGTGRGSITRVKKTWLPAVLRELFQLACPRAIRFLREPQVRNQPGSRSGAGVEKVA